MAATAAIFNSTGFMTESLNSLHSFRSEESFQTGGNFPIKQISSGD